MYCPRLVLTITHLFFWFYLLCGMVEMQSQQAPVAYCFDVWSRLECSVQRFSCFSDLLKKTCRKTCGYCTIPVCKDNWSAYNCDLRKESCHSDPEMKQHCEKACGFCTPHPDCGENKWKSGDCMRLKYDCHKPEMKKVCAKTCGICSTGGANMPLPTRRPVSSLSYCMDDWSTDKCDSQKEHCLTDDTVKRNCRKTCEICTPKVCKDDWPSRSCIVQKVFCKSDPKMEATCAKTCGYCSPHHICKDDLMSSEKCSMLKAHCLFSSQMKRKCYKTCGFCNEHACADKQPAVFCDRHRFMCHSENIKQNCKKSCGVCIPKRNKREALQETRATLYKTTEHSDVEDL